MATATLLTAADLWAMPSNGHSYELVKGELREMMPGGGFHGAVGAEVLSFILTFVRSNDLGRVFTAETGFFVSHDPDTVRAPDVAFLTHEHWEAQPHPDKYLEGAPDLAVEVVSPSDSAEEVHEKALMWLEAGSRLVWVVQPRARTVTMYYPDRSARVLRADETLEGGELLPGFALLVERIFA